MRKNEYTIKYFIGEKNCSFFVSARLDIIVTVTSAYVQTLFIYIENTLNYGKRFQFSYSRVVADRSVKLGLQVRVFSDANHNWCTTKNKLAYLYIYRRASEMIAYAEKLCRTISTFCRTFTRQFRFSIYFFCIRRVKNDNSSDEISFKRISDDPICCLLAINCFIRARLLFY